jgi:hypothetical protein
MEEPTASICRMEQEAIQTKYCYGCSEEGTRGYTIIYMTCNKNMI